MARAVVSFELDVDPEKGVRVSSIEYSHWCEDMPDDAIPSEVISAVLATTARLLGEAHAGALLTDVGITLGARLASEIEGRLRKV